MAWQTSESQSRSIHLNETERSLPQPDVPVIPDDAGLRISRENSNVDVIIQLKLDRVGRHCPYFSSNLAWPHPDQDSLANVAHQVVVFSVIPEPLEITQQLQILGDIAYVRVAISCESSLGVDGAVLVRVDTEGYRKRKFFRFQMPQVPIFTAALVGGNHVGRAIAHVFPAERYPSPLCT
mmetsp:Transcript_10193/g.21995  ORF Transcript_10193/g.21995 Transcript_10193/m.21995 type:complete len:180 (+) Transcript_10193:177-716(+)